MKSKIISTHINKDIQQRLIKSKKIFLILKPYLEKQKNINLLEIGTGSGVFPNFISKSLQIKSNIFSIDIVDERLKKSGYRFKLYDGNKLPFKNFNFDFVVLNHVIEHVGSNYYQKKLLNEISRVLKPDGVLYFAVPNKYCLVEPHYKILFLSWFPRTIASLILQLTKKKDYECYLLSYFNCKRLFKKTNFLSKNLTIQALKLYLNFEVKNKLIKKTLILPDFIFKIFIFFYPTFVFILSKKKSPSKALK